MIEHDDNERAAFEAAMRAEYNLAWCESLFAREGEDYSNPATRLAFAAWRLGREALKREGVVVPRETLEECLEDMRDLRGEHDWHKDEPRCGHAAEYARLSERIAKIEALLAGDSARGEG